MSEPANCECIQVTGDQLLTRVRELLHEGNVRRIRIHHAGHTVLELPLTVGVLGAVLLPMLAAVGGLAALITDCTIEVQRAPDAVPTTPGETAAPTAAAPAAGSPTAGGG
jgi:hypothetical protein